MLHHIVFICILCYTDRLTFKLFQAIQWGITHEIRGISWYSALLSQEISASGLYLDESGMLGASPDGSLNENELVEVKCPFSAKDCSLSELISTKKDFFLRKVGDIITLNPAHDYYHQIQGGLHLSKAQVCHLIVWTPTECFVQKILRDPIWGSNINLLKQFYCEHFFPNFLCSLTEGTSHS